MTKTLFLGAMLILGSQGVSAANLTVGAGAGFGFGDAHQGYQTTGLGLGVDLTFGLDSLFSLGPFLDYNMLNSSAGTNSALMFYGLLFRMGFGPATNLVFDAKAGLTHVSSSSLSFGFGAGMGYRVSAGLIDVIPHLGVRFLPAKFGSVTSSRTMLDAEILVSFSAF